MTGNAVRPVVRLVMMGGGKMGAALAGGLVRAGWCEAHELLVVDPSAAARSAVIAAVPGLGAAEELDADLRAEGVVIAVKPQYVDAACRTVAPCVAGGRLLSIAAGVRIAQLRAAVGDGIAVVRSMPNTPSLVGWGASAIAGAPGCDDTDLSWARGILEAVGTVVTVPEALLDAVTGLSGSGPAYVFLFAEALIEGGVLNGLPRDTARALAVQTLRGAAELLADPSADPARLRADVTSPGGTTAAGLKALEAGAVRHAVLEAVTAATERSRALAG